jgi:hypothetical protein
MDTRITYMGKLLDDLSKEELIKALVQSEEKNRSLLVEKDHEREFWIKLNKPKNRSFFSFLFGGE